MAEYALSAILAHNFRFPEFIADRYARRWAEKSVRPVAGGTLLMIGLGPIGLAIARLARLMGMQVTGLRRSPGPVEGMNRVYQTDALRIALAEADAVVMAIPLTEES